jgi:hypothetical protein
MSSERKQFRDAMSQKPKRRFSVKKKKMKYGHFQKLRWDCEICQHQCNNDQSYHRHVQCEKHPLMVVHFCASRSSILSSNSSAFERALIDSLPRNRDLGFRRMASVIMMGHEAQECLLSEE